VRRVVGNGVSEDPARAGRRFEAAIAPAAIDVEAIDIGFGDDRAAVA